MSILFCLVVAYASTILPFSSVSNIQDVSASEQENTEALLERVAQLELKIEQLEEKLEAILAATKNTGQVRFGEVIANLNDDDRMSRYIKMSIVFTVKKGNEKPVAVLVDQVRPQLRDSVYLVCAEKRIEDLRGRKNVEILRSQLRHEFNSRFSKLGHNKLIEDVLFDEINIQ